MIKRIYVDNYRCLSSFTFEPARLNLIVGDNGSGKSSLVAVLTALRTLAVSLTGLETAFTVNDRTRWDRRSSQRFELDFAPSEGMDCQWEIVLDADGPKLFVAREVITVNGVVIAERDGRAKKLLIRGKEVQMPYDLAASVLALRLEDEALQTCRALVDGILRLKLEPGAMNAISKKDDDGLAVDGSNFPSSYRATRETHFDAAARLHSALQASIGGFRSFDFEGAGEDTKRLMVRLAADAAEKTTYSVSFDELSDGQRALAVLYHVVLNFELVRRPTLFDEPDNYVALRELQPWLQKLSSCVEESGTQAFVISHNPEVIDYLAADAAWLFWRDEGGPVRVRPLPVDRESGLKPSEQLARGWIRGA
jgi:ABC-type molybdenum transport system ATPase subunit/photorepair protein PhrA